MLKAGAAVAVAHVAAKFLGILQWRVIAGTYGLTGVNDAFFFVFEGVLMTLFFIGEESLGPAFLPVFMELKKKDSEKDAWRFASTLLTLQALVLLVGVAVLMLFPEWVVAHGTRFLKGGKKLSVAVDRVRLATDFLFGMAPALFGLSLGSLTYMILNGYKRFFWAAFADAALKGALILALVCGRGRWGVQALTVGVLAAGAVKLLVHLGALRDKLRLFRPRLWLRDPAVKRFVLLVSPLLVGILFAKARDYFNNIYIPSTIEEGMVAAAGFGKKIFQSVGFLIPYPLSIAMFPFFCELVDRRDEKALGGFLTNASRMLLLVFVPVAAVLAVVSAQLTAALLQTGRFDASAVGLVAVVNACYCLALPFYALEYVLMQAYFSNRRMWTVSFIGICFSAVSMAVSGVGVLVLGYHGLTALAMIALGYSVSRLLKTLTLIGVLKRTLPFLPAGESLLYFLRVCVVGVACAAAAWGAVQGTETLLAPTRRSADSASPAIKTAAENTAAKPAEKRKEPAPTAKTPRPAGRPATITGGTGEAVAGRSVDKEERVHEKEPRPAKPVKKESRKKISGWGVLLRKLPVLAAAGAAATVVFFLCCRLLRLKELGEMLSFAREKVRRRRDKDAV